MFSIQLDLVRVGLACQLLFPVLTSASSWKGRTWKISGRTFFNGKFQLLLEGIQKQENYVQLLQNLREVLAILYTGPGRL
jgi:hypothetical protein